MDMTLHTFILDSSATGFADEGGKLDLESGSFEDEFENILLEDGDSISLEDGFHVTGDSILFEGNSDVEVQSLGGRMMSESSFAPVSVSQRNLQSNKSSQNLPQDQHQELHEIYSSTLQTHHLVDHQTYYN